MAGLNPMALGLAFGALASPLFLSTALAQAPARSHQPERSRPAVQRIKPATPAPPVAGPAYASREDVMQAANDIAQRRDLDPQWVRASLAQARLMPQAIKLIAPPPAGTRKNWHLYRSRFIEPVRIKAGVQFWQENRAALERAQSEYGVPPEIIVGIIGVETIYGRQMGNFRVLDVLATLAFDFPSAHPRAAERASFFQAELEQFLSHSSRTGTDPTLARGSYAGAMGLPQFMPSSWVRHAIDFDGDGRVDLFHSTGDAIGSVASYFKAFNWQPGMPTHYAVQFDATRLDMEALMLPDILPSFGVAGLSARGAIVDRAGMAHTGPLALVELQNGEAPPSYVIGTENFYTITRYNWSSYYAMAVIELGQAVAAALATAAPGSR